MRYHYAIEEMHISTQRHAFDQHFTVVKFFVTYDVAVTVKWNDQTHMANDKLIYFF